MAASGAAVSGEALHPWAQKKQDENNENGHDFVFRHLNTSTDAYSILKSLD